MDNSTELGNLIEGRRRGKIVTFTTHAAEAHTSAPRKRLIEHQANTKFSRL